MFLVTSSHSFNDGTSQLGPFETAEGAWYAVAVDYGTSDHGADSDRQADDTNRIPTTIGTTYRTHDDIRFDVVDVSHDWDDFAHGYVTAILWANAYTYVDGELDVDESATYAYETPGKWWEACGVALDDARSFFVAEYETLRRYPYPHRPDFGAHGHDFALTRNGHGAGFWDRGYGDVGEQLSNAARCYGEHSVITDDGPTVTNL